MVHYLVKVKRLKLNQIRPLHRTCTATRLSGVTKAIVVRATTVRSAPPLPAQLIADVDEATSNSKEPHPNKSGDHGAHFIGLRRNSSRRRATSFLIYTSVFRGQHCVVQRADAPGKRFATELS
jgi:hypothetical protein